MSKKNGFEVLWVRPSDKRVFQTEAAKRGMKQYEFFGKQVETYLEKEKSEAKKQEKRFPFEL